MPHPIHLARVYDPPAPEGGARLLVDRLWPRGIAKAGLALDGWPKPLTPSDGLRRWFHADPGRWDDFAIRYHEELAAATAAEAVAACLDLCRQGPVTLLTAARNPARSHASVLRDHLLALQEPQP